MVQIANIYPKDFSFLSDIQEIEFLLYHEAIQDKSYIEFFKKSPNYKMLDNSFYELRHEVDYDEMIKIGKEMKINEIILPDKLWDGAWTRNAVKKNLDEYHDTYKKLKWKTAAIIHGKDMDDIKETITSFMSDKRIDVVMLPRKVLQIKTWYMGRIAVWFRFQDQFKAWVDYGKEIHFLGANSWGDFFPPNSELIRSVDSKLLVKTVCNGWKWEKWTDHPPKINENIKRMAIMGAAIQKSYYGEV